MRDKPDSKPIVAKLGSVRITVPAGRFAWCTCGYSKRQPYCDGSHREFSTMRSLKIDYEKEETHSYCLCKQTSTPPYCDGTHKKLRQKLGEA